MPAVPTDRMVDYGGRGIAYETQGFGGALNTIHYSSPEIEAENRMRARAAYEQMVAAAPQPVCGHRRVICAAVRAGDGEILIGLRHYSSDMIAQINKRADGEKFTHKHYDDQGFVDQHGVYMTREEAYEVASQAGQLLQPYVDDKPVRKPKLFSEDLY